MYRFSEPQNTQARLLYRANFFFFFVLLMIAIIILLFVTLLLISFHEIEAEILLFTRLFTACIKTRYQKIINKMHKDSIILKTVHSCIHDWVRQKYKVLTSPN